MMRAGLKPHVKVWNAVMSAALVLGWTEKVESMWKEMEERQIERNIRSYCIMIILYAEKGEIDKMKSMWSELVPKRYERLAGVMITGANACAGETPHTQPVRVCGLHSILAENRTVRGLLQNFRGKCCLFLVPVSYSAPVQRFPLAAVLRSILAASAARTTRCRASRDSTSAVR
jgi:pentatricopeptide repeat protein